MDFIIRTIGNSQLNSLEKFIDFYKLISKDGVNPMSAQELQSYVALGKSNIERLREHYKTLNLANIILNENGEEVFINTGAGNLVDELIGRNSYLTPSATLAIPAYAFQKDFIRAEGNFIYRQENLNAFFSEQVQRLFGSDEYRQNYNSGSIKNTYSKRHYQVCVWVWCRGLDYPNGVILDISPFIKNVVTNVSDNGGNFNIDIASIACEFKNNRWEMSDVRHFETNNISQYHAKTATAKGATTDKEDVKANTYMFHHALNTNDIVFISFERFQGQQPDYAQYGHEVPFDELPYFTPTTRVTVTEDERDIYGSKVFNNRKARHWDMIGLIDKDTLSENPNNVSVSIQGRDLFKLLIDDKEQFYPLEYANLDVYGIFNNLQALQQSISRAVRRVDGELSAINVFVDNTIEEAISFIFSQLSHIEICPDTLFTAYGEERSFYLYAKDVQEISREYRTPIEEVVSKLKSTTGIPEKPKFKQVVNFEKILGAGIWQIIKILVDDDGTASTLKIRRVIDASIRTQQGSLLNYINRVAQYPFVDFYGDTYENKYFFIARKPPFTKKAYADLIDASDQIDLDGEGNFHIRQGDILSKEVYFDDEDVYSAYRLNPTGNFLGDNTTFTTAYLPAVFFNEYAEIWGLRAMEVESNFIDYVGTIRGNKQTPSLQTLQEQAVEDLRYVVECHAFLPFSRKGTITVKGDRRYKKGMAVRDLSTDEVFYIDGVQQTYSVSAEGFIQRSTVLEVSHGIVDKIQGSIRTFDLYFDIINYARERPIPKSNNPSANNFDAPNQQINRKTNNLGIAWRVNRKVFEYFIGKKQFAEYNASDSKFNQLLSEIKQSIQNG